MGRGLKPETNTTSLMTTDSKHKKTH